VKSKKSITVEMPDGKTYIVAAEHIAHDRATCYAKKDKDTTYAEEFEHAMGDDDEMLDWAANNMNWKDVEGFARVYKIATATPKQMQEDWVNGNRAIIHTPADMLDLVLPEPPKAKK
jgi:hypothetical protein